MGKGIIDAEEEIQEEENEEIIEEEDQGVYDEPGDEPDPEADGDREDGGEVDEEEEQEEEEEPKPKEKPKKSTNGKKRVPQWQLNKQYRLRKEAEEKARRLEKENRELRKKQNKPQEKPRPRIADFETQEDYEDALWDWRQEKSNTGQGTLDDTKTEDQETAELLMVFDDRKNELIEDDPQFAKKAYIPNALIPFVANSQVLKELALHWGENQDEALGLLSKSEREVAIEIGRLEAKILSSKNKKPQKPKTKTNAPDPTKPIGSRHTPSVDEDRMSDDDWIAKRQKERGYR